MFSIARKNSSYDEDNKKVLVKDALNHKELLDFMKSIYQTEADIKNGVNFNTKEEISKVLALRDPKKILESGNRQAMYQYYMLCGGKVDMFGPPTLVEKIKDIQKSLKGKKTVGQKHLGKSSGIL